MVSAGDHGVVVRAWMDRTAKGLTPERLLDVFDRGFAAMWQRAHLTIGPVTLTAIVDRVLWSAAEQYPILAGLKVEASGLQCEALYESAESLPSDHLPGAISFVLVEFLTVLGNLTAEILTPALHSELSSVAPEKESPDATRSPGKRRAAKSKG